MHARIRRPVLAVLAIALGAVAAPGAAQAQGASADGMPTQAQTDRASTEPGAFGPGWGDLPGGVAARPYVTSLSVINGGVTTPVVTGGTTTATLPSAGGITTVIAPFNLCRAGQAPVEGGQCYATPNRVGLTLVYSKGRDTNGYDFGAPSVPVTPRVDADTIFDMTIELNTLGRNLRWTGLSGDLLYWRTTDLGRAGASVRVRFRPAPRPVVNAFPPGNGCTATPLFDCAIDRADGQTLSANMVLSLDETLDSTLTGAAFATQNAIAGFLQPGGTALAPSLDVQVASTHDKADGSPQLGTLKAFIPAATLLNLYGLLPADATAFTTSRRGDAGSNSAPTYTRWSAGDEGSDGLLVTVRDITFSVPEYRVAAKLKALRATARARRGRTTVTTTVAKCGPRTRRLATLYDLGPGTRARFVARKTTVLRNASVTSRRITLAGRAAKLKKGDRYLLVVRAAKGKKLLGTALGTVR